MTNLTPVPTLDDVVEHPTDELLLAGPGGPLNQQAQSLLNRTEFLKDSVDVLQQFDADLQSEVDTAKGSSLIGWLRAVTGAVGAKLSALLSWQEVHAFEFFTVAQIAAIQAGTAGDVRATLQLALDAAVGKTLRINAGLWQMTPLSQDNPTVGLCLDVPSNIRIVFDVGAKIELTAHNHTIYQMFRIWDRDNVVIERATLSGRRDLNAAVSGEFGMCIDIRGGSNIHLIDPETDDAWGDGIYVGQTNTAESVNGLTISNHRAKNNRRQGGSLVSARNFTLNGGLAGDTAGTAPSAGWDIEPNNNSAVLEGIKFIGLNTYNNAGSGLVIELGQFAGAEEKTIDIEVIGHTDDGSTVGVSINGLKNLGTVKGSINISGTWKNNENQGVVSADYSGEGPQISVNGTVINCNRSGQVSAKYGSACVVLRDTTSLTSYPIGNIDFDGMRIECTSGTILKPFYFDDTLGANTNVINVHFRNPKKLSGLTSNAGGFFGLGTISNDFENWVEKLAGSTNLSANLYAPIEFADASSNINLVTPSGTFVRGAPDIIIKKPNNTNQHSVVALAGSFIGLGGTITTLRSIVADSYLRLRPMGSDKFAIIERVGLWTEVV